jgi:putative copper resistance protein D
LGIVSVGTLLVTGIVNASILVGLVHALLITEYGQLLMLKIVVFAIMLPFATVNRFRLTPRLAFSSESEVQVKVLSQLTRNSVIEIALRVTIFAIVGAARYAASRDPRFVNWEDGLRPAPSVAGAYRT